MHDAAAIAGVHYKVLYRLRPKLGIGTLVHGKWHFRRKELIGISPPRRGAPRTTPYATRQEYHRAYYQQHRERILARSKAYNAVYQKSEIFRRRHRLMQRLYAQRKREQQAAA